MFLRISSISSLSQKSDLFRLSRIAVNAMTLVQLFPSCLVSNPIYRRSALFPIKLTIEFMEYYSHLPNMASTFWLASWATDSEPIRAREITVLVKSNQLVKKHRDKTTLASQSQTLILFAAKSRPFSLLVSYNTQPSSSSTNQKAALIIDHQLDFTKKNQP